MTIAYPELPPTLAMPIGGCGRLADTDACHWAALAEEVTLGLPLIRRIAKLGAAVRRTAPEVARELAVPGLDADALSRFRATASDRAERCMASITTSGRTKG